MIGVRMDYIKRILTIALCSILLICTCPSFSFHSEAAEAALTSEFLRSAIGYLSGYLLSKGYSIGKRANFDIDDALTATFGDQYQLYKSFFDLLSAESEEYSNLIQNAVTRAVNSGVFSVSEDVDNWFSDYVSSLTIDNSIFIGSSTQTFNGYDANTSFAYSFNTLDISTSVTTPWSFSVSCNYDCIPIISYVFKSDGFTIQAIRLYFLPSSKLNTTQANNAIVYSFDYNSHADVSIGTTYLSSDLGYVPYFNLSFNNTRYGFSGFNFPAFLSGIDVSTTYLASVTAYYREYGYFDSTVDFVSSQLHDTTDIDILSSASEIDPDTGTVSGGFTMYMRDWSLFQEVLKQFSEGIISWNQAIKALGLSQVDVNATPAEKESALDKVAFPDSTYDWLSSTTWGDSITQSIKDEVSDAHDTELDIADQVSLTVNGGNEPSEEDKQKAGNAALLGSLLMWLGLWNPPSFDPDNPGDPGISGDESNDPSSPDFLGETLAGMAVVGSLIDDLWNVSGGSKGLGIVFTIAASFMIFSVVIGAANYIGSLGNDIESRSQSKYAAQDRAKSGRQGFIVKGRKGA